MPKLLSQEEVRSIAAKMTETYGLPPAEIVEDNYYNTESWGVKVKIFRRMVVPRYESKWLRGFTKVATIKVREFYGNDYEDALTKLELELKKFDGRANTAEHFREKFAMQEADEALTEVLRNETPIV
jgi:hypothetical protein